MRIDLKAIGNKAAAQVTLPNIFGATSVALLIIINWEVLVLRYRAIVEWAPGVPPAVAQAYSILISVAMAALLYRAIGSVLELVYFGPLKKLNKLEKKAHEEIPQLQGRSFCQSMLLSILAGGT